MTLYERKPFTNVVNKKQINLNKLKVYLFLIILLKQINIFNNYIKYCSQDFRVMISMGYLIRSVIKKKLLRVDFLKLVKILRKKKLAERRKIKLNKITKFKNMKIKNNILRLYISFGKRNIFFNLTGSKGNTLFMTTTRRQGYLGRRRVEYASVFSTTRTVKNMISKYKEKNLIILYKGWHRFRNAIESALEVRDTKFDLDIKYTKYVIKIPHNGCRLSKKPGRKFVKSWFNIDGSEKF